MKIEEQNILMLSRTMGLGGTEKVVLQLCEILSPYAHKIVVCSTGGVMVQKLTEMGIRHYEIPDITNKSPQNVLRILRQLRKIIRQENITVIHAHHRMAAFYSMLLQKVYGFYFLATAHNVFLDKKNLCRMAYRKCSIIACGEMVKNNLTDYYGLPESQVTVIHNAVKAFDGAVTVIPELQAYRQAGDFLVGCVSRLDKVKGVDIFLRAAAQVASQKENVKFIIAGEGPERKALEKMTQDLGLFGKVRFLGFQDAVQSLMSQMDVIILSSWMEGLPLSPMEAFSVGIPVIATAVDGTKEIVQDGINGILVETGDYQSIATGIIRMIDEPAWRRELSKQAYITYKDKFSYNVFADQILNYYRNEVNDSL